MTVQTDDDSCMCWAVDADDPTALPRCVPCPPSCCERFEKEHSMTVHGYTYEELIDDMPDFDGDQWVWQEEKGDFDYE